MDNKTIVLTWAKAADTGDWATLEKLFGTKHQFYSPMGPEPLDTPQRLGLMKGFHTSFSNLNHEVIDIFEAGNKAVLRGVWVGTNTGVFNNMPASGKTVRSPFIAIFEIENDVIMKEWLEFDMMSFMQQLGAIPAPQAAN